MSENHYRLSKFQLLKSLIRNGHFALIFREFRRRLYSDGYLLLLHRDISFPSKPPEPDIRVRLRTLQSEDIPKLLNIDDGGLSSEDVLERIRLLRLLNSGIKECYVAETEDGFPCHICWLLNSSQNEKIKTFYGGGILPLAPNEIVVEGSFTHEKYRRLGIQKWRRIQLWEKSLAMGANQAIAYVRHDNIPSLKSDISVGFKLLMIRKDRWRIFRRSFIFKPVPESTLYPLENEQIEALLQS